MSPFYDAHREPLEDSLVDALRDAMKAAHRRLKVSGVCHICRGLGEVVTGRDFRADNDPDQDRERCADCAGSGDGDYPAGA